jgi:hypothetical protein
MPLLADLDSGLLNQMRRFNSFQGRIMAKHKERPEVPKPVGCPPGVHGKTTTTNGQKAHGRLILFCMRCGGQVTF